MPSLFYVIALLLRTGTKPKWQIWEKGAGEAVTHKLKHSTGKGGDEHAA